MNYAHEDQRFKAAINEFLHKQLARHLKAKESIEDMSPSYCDRASEVIIFKEWKKCLTENDINEIETHCIEEAFSSVPEFQHQERKYFEDDFEQEMRNQINILIDEAQRNGERVA